MKRERAKTIAKLLKDQPSQSGNLIYRLEDSIENEILSDFHHWADSWAHEGAFFFREYSGESLWVLLSEWGGKGDFYMVLFPESRSGPIAEIYKVVEGPVGLSFEWLYAPRKHDDQNEERKGQFREYYGSERINIIVPGERNLTLSNFLMRCLPSYVCAIRRTSLWVTSQTPTSGFRKGEKNNDFTYRGKGTAPLCERQKRERWNAMGVLSACVVGSIFMRHIVRSERGLSKRTTPNRLVN